MENTKSKKPVLTEIGKCDLKNVSAFLHQHMNNNFSPEVWESGINKCWLESSPNYGFMLIQEGEIVGVLCAIYSEQYVNGDLKKFCNPHSWCVLPEYRTRSVDLVLSVIRQPGYHFTMFSPNSSGVEIFGYLKFKRLDNTTSIVLNVPAFNVSRVHILGDTEDASSFLKSPYNKYHKEHTIFPWLKIIVFGVGGNYGFILYKKQLLKKLACARILYVSDANLFQRCWPVLRTYLLLRHGMVTSKIETRFLSGTLFLTLKNEPDGRKFYLSSELDQGNIHYLYSELVTLDI